MREILDTQIPPPQGRVNPRVVKKPRSKFPAKKRYPPNQGAQRPQLIFTISNSA
jgi:hypothetical protein